MKVQWDVSIKLLTYYNPTLKYLFIGLLPNTHLNLTLIIPLQLAPFWLLALYYLFLLVKRLQFMTMRILPTCTAPFLVCPLPIRGGFSLHFS